MRPIDPVIEERIKDFFDRNLLELEADRGHALAPGVRRTALEQVRLYYRRLRDIADRVTDTEVRLGLPGQHTPAGREFAIEGIVDIVREKDRTVLYDIKTHDADEIRGSLPEYEKQLNVYAHIWQGLRGEPLDETAVICTRYPRAVEQALLAEDEAALTNALALWEPVIPVPFDAGRVEAIIHEFGETVDEIEDHQFGPPAVDHLRERLPGMKTVFAVAICRNCDARFSCSSYRTYALSSNSRTESAFRQYIEDLGDDVELEEIRLAAFDEAPADITNDL